VVDGDENDCALRGLTCDGSGWVARVDGDEDVHAAAPGVDQVGVEFDEFTDADGAVEVNVADAGDDAAAATPLYGDGVGGLVDPLEQRAAADGVVVAGVTMGDQEAADCPVAEGVRWCRRLGVPGRLCPLPAIDRCREPSRVACCVVCILIGLPRRVCCPHDVRGAPLLGRRTVRIAAFLARSTDSAAGQA
jgi:hypothetical protein